VRRIPLTGRGPLINPPIRVLFYLFFPSGGIGKYTHQLVEELVNYDDLEIEVACLPDYQWRDNEAYCTWPGLFGISHRAPTVRRLRFLLGQFINPRRLIKRARQVDADIIHICNINYLSFPFWARRLNAWQGKLVCSAHDVRRATHIIHRGWEERQLKRFYRHCDALFVHSMDQVDELMAFAGIERPRIFIVPHGPHVYAPPPAESQDELRSRYRIPPGRQVALFFGYLREDKNLDGFIRAMHEARIDDLHLLVAGDKAAHGERYLMDCRIMVNELGMADRVTFDVRYIPDRELPALLKLCDWAALPHNPTFSSMSGVLNLAAFYERPVLVTPTVSFRELLADVAIGELCSSFEDADIAQGIRRMVNRVREGAKWDFEAYRARYSWESNAEITHQVYRQLMVAAP
jgi:glycosyltransferase involved in cell wall biosynthesis